MPGLVDFLLRIRDEIIGIQFVELVFDLLLSELFEHDARIYLLLFMNYG